MRRTSAWLEDNPRAANRLALAICVLVVVVRVLISVTSPAPELVGDAVGYDQAARRLLDQGYYAYTRPEFEGTPWPNAVMLPGYSVFLALAYAPWGPGVAAQPLVSIAQALLSGTILWAVYLLGMRIHSRTAGLVAICLSALYLPFWWSYRYALTEDLFTALCLWAAYLIVAALDEPVLGRRLWRVIATGVLVAAAMHVRAAAAPWILTVGTLLVVLDRPRRRQHLMDGAILAVTIVMCMSPWWIRNAHIYDEFVPFSSITATGNLLATFEDPQAPQVPEGLLDWDFTSASDELRSNDAIESLASDRVHTLLEEDPLGFAALRARAIAISVMTYHPNPYGNFRGIAGLAEAIHLALLGLAAWGYWHFRRRPEVWVMAAMPIALIAMHSTTLIFSRYLFPMMPFVLVLAAIAVTQLSARPRA